MSGPKMLGGLPPDLQRERSSRGKRILDPGTYFHSDWINRNTASLYPFTIGTSARRILPANPLRTYILIQNKSTVATNYLYVNFGQNPTAFASVQIEGRGNYELIGGANGGSFCPQDDIYILGAAAGIIGAIIEGIWTPQAKVIENR